MSEKRSPLVLGLLALALIANGIGAFILSRELKTFQTRVEALEHAVELYRYERTSKYEGVGFNALLDHLVRWAPVLQRSGPGVEGQEVQAKVENISATMASLPGAAAMIETALRGSGAVTEDPATDDEVRKWLLRSAYANNPELGKKLYVDTLRNQGFEHHCSSRLRLIATHALLEVDKKTCGETLHELLAADASSTIKTGKSSLRAGAGRSNFFNFIDPFVASEHPKVNALLMRLLLLTDIDLISLQRCVEMLGKRKYRPAAPRIQELYFKQQPIPGQVPNPIFRRKCVIAVDNILGAEAKPFFAKVDQRETDPAIQKLMNEIKLKYGRLN